MKKIIYLGDPPEDRGLVYFQFIGKKNRMGLSESTLEYLILHPETLQLTLEDIEELKRGLTSQ
ncbi:MAG: hypothetical protein AAF694_11320 [Bacteroidota bacterium]